VVAGEKELVRSSPPAQPGDREPAPGDLALVQSFINSHYDLEHDHGAELFATPAGLGEWLAARGLIERAHLGPRDLRRAIAVREGLRTVARANTGSGQTGRLGAPPAYANTRSVETAGVDAALAALNDAARGATVEIRLHPHGSRFTPSERGGLDSAIGVLLATVAAAMIDGSWSRLKVCPGRHCGWAFYDHSRNQSGRWCSMAVCGGRAKARAHYRRRRAEAD
jgi:predicted RNA-binding Zn ribbon-like protein